MIILSTLAYLLVFFYLYILTMGIYRAHLSKRLTGLNKVLCYPIVILAVIVDVVAQYTIATLFFLDLPDSGERLVTARLQRYVASGKGKRYLIASYICDNLLDPFDPTGEHC